MTLSFLELPLGHPEVLMPGADLMLLTWGTPVYHCKLALALLMDPPASLTSLVLELAHRARIELINLRTILPWNIDHRREGCAYMWININIVILQLCFIF